MIRGASVVKSYVIGDNRGDTVLCPSGSGLIRSLNVALPYIIVAKPYYTLNMIAMETYTSVHNR